MREVAPKLQIFIKAVEERFVLPRHAFDKRFLRVEEEGMLLTGETQKAVVNGLCE